MYKVKGVDVSEWQGNVDFNAVKSDGYSFVIIRAGYGRFANQKDPYFEQNYARAKAAGLGVGAYWYSYANSTKQALEEAHVCLSVIEGKKFEYPIYFDLEEQDQLKYGRTFCSELVVTFCNAIENAGYYAGLYMSRSPLENYITGTVAERYAVWVAEYNTQCNYSGNFGMWQYSGNSKINGVENRIDLNECYVDYPKIIKEGGLNGYGNKGGESMNFDTYFSKVLGKGIDYDGVYNVQCFDLANDYAVKVLGCKPFIGLYAYEIYTNFSAQPSAARYTKIANTPDFVPIKGDIMVWAKSLNGTAGHVAICTGEGDTNYFYSYDQNWNGRNDPCTKVKHTYDHVLGVLRPKEQSLISGNIPTQVLDTEGCKRGDKNLAVSFLKSGLKMLGFSNLDDTNGFGGGTEAAVNKVLVQMGYKPNGIAGANFAKLFLKR